MDKFFYPQSMVIFGASVAKVNLAHIVILNNKQNGYKGRLYGIGSQEGDIEGVPVYKDVESVPEIPDVAVILTPAITVPDLLDSCGRKGIKHIVIETGGFGEYSRDGFSLQDKILAIADTYGMKVLGPNCVGTVNYDIRLVMPFGFFKVDQDGGRMGLITQSGGVGGDLPSYHARIRDCPREVRFYREQTDAGRGGFSRLSAAG